MRAAPSQTAFSKKFNASPLHLHRNYVPIHTGHLIVEDHRIHRVRSEQLQPLVPASRFQNFIAILFEQHLAADESISMVVDAKDCWFQLKHLCSQSNSARTVSISCALPGWKLPSPITEVAGKSILTTSPRAFKLPMDNESTV